MLRVWEEHERIPCDLPKWLLIAEWYHAGQFAIYFIRSDQNIYIYIYIIMVYIYVCISSIIQEKGEDIGLAIVSRNVNGKSFAQLRINIEWLYLE